MKNYPHQLVIQCFEQQDVIPFYGNNKNRVVTLDEHQKEAMALSADALSMGESEISIVHACGSGKTILEGNLLIASQNAKARLARAGEHKDLIITTERSLIHSVRDELTSIGLDVGIWGDGLKQIDNHPIVLASIQSLQAPQEDLGKIFPIHQTDLIIGDEADRYLTEARSQLIKSFRKSIKIGLTATPSWPDGRDISDVWGRKVHHLSLKEGIEKGINVGPIFYAFESGLDASKLKLNKGDYEQKTLARALKEAEIHLTINEVYESVIPFDQRKNFPTLIFVPSVDLVNKVEKELREKYGKSEMNIAGWTGEKTTSRELHNDIDAFNKGEIDILVLCEMGGRGLNLPRARCIIDAYPTLSANKLEQRHGRGTRKIRIGSALDQSSFKKPFSIAIQIIPQSNSFRPLLLPDIIDGWEDYQAGRVLGHRDHHQTGAPIQEEVQALRNYIESQKPTAFTKLVQSSNFAKNSPTFHQLPQANHAGMIVLNGERYGTLESWSRELELSSVTVKKYLGDKSGITGKDHRGKTNQNAFYPETIVRQVLGPLVGMTPQADENGFIIKDEESENGFISVRYSSKIGWSKELGVSRTEIGRKLKGRKGVTGKNKGGTVQKNGFFSETTMMEIFADLLKLPQANEKGFFMKEDKNGQSEQYALLSYWATEYCTSIGTIKSRLEKYESTEGRDCKGRRFYFYTKTVVTEACSDLKKDYPQVDDKGFFVIQHEGESKRYGSLTAIANEFGITVKFLKGKVQNIKGITAKTSKNVVYENNYYSVEEVKEGCKDIIRELPKANDDGFFILEEEGQSVKYGTLVAWSKVLGVSSVLLKDVAKGLTPISGKDRQNRIWDKSFYPESNAFKKFQNIPHSNENGTFIQEGERYALLSFWSKYFKITRKAIKKRVPLDLAITGKDETGTTHRNAYFSEKNIKEHCQDLIEVPQANDKGFFTLFSEEGEAIQYATINTWATELKISKNDIHKLMKGQVGITGRIHKGKILQNCYHPHSTLEERGVIALSKLPRANNNGFFSIFEEEKSEGKRYATKYTWAQELGISPMTVKSKIGHLTGISGRDHGGRILKGNFYEEQAVREACKNIRRKK